MRPRMADVDSIIRRNGDIEIGAGNDELAERLFYHTRCIPMNDLPVPEIGCERLLMKYGYRSDKRFRIGSGPMTDFSGRTVYLNVVSKTHIESSIIGYS